MFEVEMEYKGALALGKIVSKGGKQLTEKEQLANQSEATFRSHDSSIARAKLRLRKARG